MADLLIAGGCRLEGETVVQGAKNSALPLLAAAFLCGERVVLDDCPDLSDVRYSIGILNSLGAQATLEGHRAVILPASDPGSSVSDELMRKMRSSVIFLGAMLGRTGRAEITYPGGCGLGSRPIDLHLDGFRRMGVTVKTEGGKIVCAAKEGLCGAEIALGFPSVGATENLMIAATAAKGETVLMNAAREPEIADLAAFLNRCGGRVEGAGGDRIKITGSGGLRGCEYRVMSDRIAAATVMAAAAICGGEVYIRGARRRDMEAVLSAFSDCGARICSSACGIFFSMNRRPRPIRDLKTMPYPGFPTDAQPLLGAVLAYADGTSTVTESIFDHRFAYTAQLCRMGADVRVYDRVAVFEGRRRLSGAQLETTDLRGGAAAVCAALGADGDSVISDVGPIERGYEDIAGTFSALGARIEKKD